MGLEIREIKHSFGDLVALDGVSFAVVPGAVSYTHLTLPTNREV